MEHFNTALNTLSAPLREQTMLGEAKTAANAPFRRMANQCVQALSMPQRAPQDFWHDMASRLQQSSPNISPWSGALPWQTALSRLQQGLSNEDVLSPEALLESEVEDDVFALPDMPEPDADLFDFDAVGEVSTELDAVFVEATVDPSSSHDADSLIDTDTTTDTADFPEPDVESIIAEAAEPEIEEDISVAVGHLSESEAVVDAEVDAEAVHSVEAHEVNVESHIVVDTEESDDEVMHIHVSAGEHQEDTEQWAEQAPQLAQNPIMAATQQALHSAAVAAAEVVPPPASTPVPLVFPETSSSQEFFASLPWSGIHEPQ